MSDGPQREALVEAGRRMVGLGLTHGTSGNLSVRVEGGCLITPTALAVDRLDPGDMVMLHLDGTHQPGVRAPSSEWRFHCDIYRTRPEAGAVVHAHPPHATAIACLRRDIPAVHYMVALAGGHSIRCAEYATFGTEALSVHALSALEGRRACLLANHGVVALGAGLEQALGLLHEVERVAEVYGRALAAGTPVSLDDQEMARVLERFREYRK